MIYWAFDRKAGRKILAGLGGGLFINGFLKLTFCVYRPWIRDTRILPYGDSKTAAKMCIRDRYGTEFEI